ncbi:MAG TPA: NB-ARC domain-containing protein, partial [Streptomyces sp.]
MSGAVVFSDDPELGPLAVGLLIEHHLPEGASTLTLAPLSDLTALAEGTDWGWRLGLDTWTVLPRGGPRPAPPATGHLALRRPLSDFTDRERLAAQAQTLLTDRLSQTTPVVVLYGMPGVGKTALANHIAHRLAPTFSHARILVDLGGSGTTEVTPDGAMIQALQGFGLFGNDLPRETRQRRYMLHRLLRAGPSLLVLDNVVRASQIEPLLPESPGSAVLLTSRSALTSVEGADRLPVAPLADPDGLRLLERITGAERVSRERDAAGAIVSLLGGLPLAIRIAATSAASPAGQHHPLSFHAAQLADEQALVSHLSGEDKSVRSSFEISYRGLRPDTARLFRHLGLLAAADFAPELAARACDVTPDHAERMLGELADRQLVEVSGPAGDRYRLHDLLRLYARERAESDESAADRRSAFRRSLRWYADCLETWMSRPDAHERPPAEAVAWFADEFLNVNASMRAAFADEQWDLLLRIAGSLYGLLFYRGHWEEMETIKGMAVEAARREHDEPAELGSLIHLAEARRILGRAQDTPPLYERAQEIARTLGDTTQRAWILTHFGDLQCDLGRPRDALVRYAEADALYRASHDEGGRIWLAAHIADAHRQLSQPAEAARVL